jgi:hypothetical protein
MNNANNAITVSVGETEIRFDVGTADYNRFLNETTPGDKVGPAWNLLIGTVHPDDKEFLKTVAMRDGLPNGVVALQIVGAIAEEFGAAVAVTVKKPKPSPSK